MPRTIEEERQLFQAAIDELLANGKEGKYVLFKGGEVQGFFTSEQEAYEAGLDKFGLEPFLVDLVMERERLNSWTPPSMQFYRG